MTLKLGDNTRPIFSLIPHKTKRRHRSAAACLFPRGIRAISAR